MLSLYSHTIKCLVKQLQNIQIGFEPQKKRRTAAAFHSLKSLELGIISSFVVIGTITIITKKGSWTAKKANTIRITFFDLKR